MIMNNKTIDNMTVDEFKEVPYRDNWQGDIECSCIVILPSVINHKQLWLYSLRKWLSIKFSWFSEPNIYDVEGLHDSGYRQMDFVLIKDEKPLCRAAGGSDVLHLGGIGGYKLGFYREKVKPIGWSIDCLPKSGLLRLFTGNLLVAGSALSSFEIWEKEKEERDGKKG